MNKLIALSALFIVLICLEPVAADVAVGGFSRRSLFASSMTVSTPSPTVTIQQTLTTNTTTATTTVASANTPGVVTTTTNAVQPTKRDFIVSSGSVQSFGTPTAVPEPSAFALLALAASGLGAIRWKRSRL